MRDLAPGLALLLALPVSGAPALAGGSPREPLPVEVDLLAAHSERSADGLDDVRSDRLSLRLAAGGRWRVRVVIPYLRLEDPEGGVPTPFGAAPLSAEQRARRAAAGGQGAGGSAGGPGGETSGASAARATAAATAAATGIATASGLGDARIGVLGAIAGGGARLFRVDAELDAKAPTGDEDEGLGTGAWDVRAGILGERRFWSWTAFGGAGWTRVGDPDWIDLRDAADAYAGFETEPRAGGVLWSVWAHAAGEVVPGTGDALALSAGARGSSRVGWRVAVTGGLAGPAPDLSISIGLGWRPERARPRTPPEVGR